jgi:hypothetical protein
MTLQTSGQISLNDIHREAGGSGQSGRTAGMNDADIRALIGKGSGATSGFNEFYGASAGSFVIDEGSYSTSYGYSRVGQSYGQLSGKTDWRGATVLQIATTRITIKGSTSYLLAVRIQGNRASNWFQSIKVGAYTHTYNSFSRSYSGSTLWIKGIPSAAMMNGVGNTTGTWT